MYIISIMSGNSLDGVDISYVKAFDKKTFKLLKFKHSPYNKQEREIFNLIFPIEKLTIEKLSKLNFKLAYIFSEKIKNFIKENNLKKIDLIVNSGQTIYHKVDTDIPSTLQLGYGSVIANKLDILTISNLRVADIAVGGHGAPLVAFVDNLLFNDKDKNQILLNIGGIANITFLPKKDIKQDYIIAFDTGPGNILIDYFTKLYTKGKMLYDKDGKFASKGLINNDLLKFLNSHPYIKKIIPKSTGKEDFGINYAKKILKNFKHINMLDIIKTLTYFTAYSIYINIKNFIPYHIDEIIISGGGVNNKEIIKFLKHFFVKTKFYNFEEKFKISYQCKESFAFAVLGYYTIYGLYNNISNKKTILGDISLNPSFKGKIIL